MRSRAGLRARPKRIIECAAFKCSSHSALYRPHATATALAASPEAFSDRAATIYGRCRGVVRGGTVALALGIDQADRLCRSLAEVDCRFPDRARIPDLTGIVNLVNRFPDALLEVTQGFRMRGRERRGTFGKLARPKYPGLCGGSPKPVCISRRSFANL
jgi:hypothetical protein